MPLTNKLAEEFLGYPLDPSIGMRWGLYNASIGLGDLLVYALFMITAFKAYGRVAARLAIVLVAIFGAVAPALAPLLVDASSMPAPTWWCRPRPCSARPPSSATYG